MSLSFAKHRFFAAILGYNAIMLVPGFRPVRVGIVIFYSWEKGEISSRLWKELACVWMTRRHSNVFVMCKCRIIKNIIYYFIPYLPTLLSRWSLITSISLAATLTYLMSCINILIMFINK